MTNRIHVSLNTRDLAPAVAFYEALFGQQASKRREDYANFRLNEPPIHLSLVVEPNAQANQGHLGVELGDHEQLQAWKQRAEAARLGGRVEDDTVCCYARGDKLWLDDPDGNAWELWVRTGEADTMTTPEDNCCASACGCAPSRD